MGASGALGSFAVQIAKLAGARVIAAAGSDERAAAALRLGAENAVNYRTVDLLAEIVRLTGGGGVNLVFRRKLGSGSVAESIREVSPTAAELS